MAILSVVGTGSAGNTYAVENESEILILDAGIGTKSVLKSIDYHVSKIRGVLITHVHGDHAKYIGDYLKMGIKVYMPEQVKENYKGDLLAIPVLPMKSFKIGGFTVVPFEVPHDKDVTCFAYLISEKSIGKLLYMTDCIYCKYNLQKQEINHFLVECHHSNEMLNEYQNGALRDRVFQTHMDLQTCKEFIRSNRTADMRNVILCHLGRNSNAGEYFAGEIQNIVGTSIPVMVAEPGLSVELIKDPF